MAATQIEIRQVRGLEERLRKLEGELQKLDRHTDERAESLAEALQAHFSVLNDRVTKLEERHHD